MIDMAVNIAIRQKTDEMKPGIMGVNTINQFLPNLSVKEGSFFNRMIYEAGTLLKNPATPDGIMANFAIAHIVIRRHADCFSMCVQPGGEAIACKPIQSRRICLANNVTFFIFADADPIQDGKDYLDTESFMNRVDDKFQARWKAAGFL